MTRGSVAEYAEALRGRYRRAGKRAKGQLLDEFCRVTGYHRKAAVRLLNRTGPSGTGRRSGRPKRYGPEVAQALQRLWEVADGLSGKLLVPFLPVLVEQLERHGELSLPADVRTALLQLSPATADRLLAPYRRGRAPRQPWTHRAAAAGLRAQVPLRTFGEWEAVQPGAFQADLVAHCGDSVAGFYLTTLVAVDVASDWTELEAVWGKGESRVGAGFQYLHDRLPMPIRSLHTDNGGEFLNRAMLDWCRRREITSSRGRPYRKNDQAWAEQRNWTAVRRRVGYDRYSTKAAHAELTHLYTALRDYLNFFQPVRKVAGKERQGAHVKRRFDPSQTPYQRLLGSGVLDADAAQALTARFQRLNPVVLRAQIDESLERLSHLADHAYAR